jgi:uncharacterized membrane protein
MNKNKEENVVFVLQKAIKHFKIKVTNTSVKDFLLAHPYYPSLKSICDALNKWKIENYPLSLELEEIKALEMPFIAHSKISGGQFVFVKGIKNGLVTFYTSEGKAINEDFEKFSEKLSGAVVVMEAGKESGEKEYRFKRQDEILDNSLLPFGIIILAFLTVFNFVSGGTSSHFGFQFIALVLTKIFGLTASIFLVLHEFKVHTPLADKICGFSSKTDCDTILSSNASKLFAWVNWADAGIIFFSGTLIFLLGASGNNSLWILSIISALSLPYPVFSIYYQSVKLKKWCPFCLMVQLVLIVEFFLLIPVFKSVSFSSLELLQLIISFSIPAVIWLIFKAFYNKSEEQKKEHYSFLQFKRNPDVFLHLLQRSGYTEFHENENSLALGNPDAKLTITAFLSLYCSPCAGAFNKLKKLLDDCPEVKVNAVFSVYNDDESKKLINTLYSTYYKKGAEQTLDFLYKWYSMPKQNRKSMYENGLQEDDDVAKQVGEKNKALFEQYKIVGTPTICVNGYKFPTQYEYSDMEYYIDEIKNLTRENKRQEACVNCI